MKNIRNKEEAVMEAFKSIFILDKDGNEHPVPVICGSKEKAHAFMTHSFIRSEPKTPEIIVDKIRLPLISLTTVEIGASIIAMEGMIYTM